MCCTESNEAYALSGISSVGAQVVVANGTLALPVREHDPYRRHLWRALDIRGSGSPQR